METYQSVPSTYFFPAQTLRTHTFLFRAIVCTLALRLLGAFAPATHVVPHLGGAGNCLECRCDGYCLSVLTPTADLGATHFCSFSSP